MSSNNQPACTCVFHSLPRAELIALIDRAVAQVNAEALAHGGHVPLDFDDEWELAPLSATRTTEQESARWWYECGRRAERARVVAEGNADVREMARLVKVKFREGDLGDGNV